MIRLRIWHFQTPGFKAVSSNESPGWTVRFFRGSDQAFLKSVVKTYLMAPVSPRLTDICTVYAIQWQWFYTIGLERRATRSPRHTRYYIAETAFTTSEWEDNDPLSTWYMTEDLTEWHGLKKKVDAPNKKYGVLTICYVYTVRLPLALWPSSVDELTRPLISLANGGFKESQLIASASYSSWLPIFANYFQGWFQTFWSLALRGQDLLAHFTDRDVDIYPARLPSSFTRAVIAVRFIFSFELSPFIVT